MKKYLIPFLLILIAVPVFSQEKKIPLKTVPPALINSLKMEYPNSKLIGATREITKGDTAYEIESMDSLIKRSVTFHTDGIPIEIEETMDYDQLPFPVKNAITSQYPKGKVLVTEMIMRGPEMTYEITIKDKKKKIEIEYGMDGKVIPKKK